MRRFVLGCIGLLSISWLAGCGSVHDRNDCTCERGNCRCTNATRPRLAVLPPVEGARSVALVKGLRKRGDVIEMDTETTNPVKMPAGDILEMYPPPGSREHARNDEPQFVPAIPVVDMPTTRTPRRDDDGPLVVPITPPMPSAAPKPDLVINMQAVAANAPLPRIVDGDPAKVKEQIVTTKSVDVRFGHNEKFETITGQVQQWRKSYRLRYAPIDQDDPHGGSVTLEGSADLTKLRDGQRIRVRGMLIPADDRTSAARYRVDAIELLD